jgi:hypothetical protein
MESESARPLTISSLELESGLDTSAIALAKRYGVRVVGIEQNPNNVEIALARAA